MTPNEATAFLLPVHGEKDATARPPVTVLLPKPLPMLLKLNADAPCMEGPVRTVEAANAAARHARDAIFLVKCPRLLRN